MLHIIYRSYGGENKKGRPDYYSKLLSLASFIRSFAQLKPGVAEVIFLNDGPIPADRLRLMEPWGEVVARSNLGLRGSWEATLALPLERGWPKDDLVWLAEDDYLYLPNSLNDLVAAAEASPDVEYFALYAMVGSRLPNGDTSDDRVPHENRWLNTKTRLVNGHPWRGAISTTATFGARVGTLIEDRSMMQLAIRAGGAWDHTICLIYQGFAPFPMSSLMASLVDPASTKNWLQRAATFAGRMGMNVYKAARAVKKPARRALLAADPALITHLETDFLARGTDWRSIAISTQQWANADAAVPAVSAAALPPIAAVG
jgi:hypothetical protein